MIGLFLGGTDFPKLILENIKKKKEKYFIIDLTKKNLFKDYKNSYFVSIGKFGKILDIINKNKCKKVLFAGKIEKPLIKNLRLDTKGVYYMPRLIKVFKLGDAAILKELILILAENKIKVIKSNFFNPELTLKKGIYTEIKPNKKALLQIQSGLKSFKKLNAYNHTQAIIVEQNGSVHKETSKGTKKMIETFDNKKDDYRILIKFPKKKQDLRADLPTIGLDTLKDCKKAKLKGIVLKAKQNIFLDQKKSISFADKNNIFIYVL
jgi:DUF1009 family protein